MKHIGIAILVAAWALVPLRAPAQNAGIAPGQGAGQAGNVAAQANILRITAPKPGEQLRQNIVEVAFELLNDRASAAGVPNFQVKIDSQDPVRTSSTTYTFTGLAPGPHTVSVQLVDANNTPIAGARSEVQFVILKPEATPRASLGLRYGPAMIPAALRLEAPQAATGGSGQEELPSAAGALPLLSVIGFGVLLGGIASAMRTRR